MVIELSVYYELLIYYRNKHKFERFSDVSSEDFFLIFGCNSGFSNQIIVRLAHLLSNILRGRILA